MTYGMSLEDGEPKALDQMKMQYTTIDTFPVSSIYSKYIWYGSLEPECCLKYICIVFALVE